MTALNESQTEIHQKSNQHRYNIWLNFIVALLATNLLSIYIVTDGNTDLGFVFQEDGVLESLSAVFYFLAAGIFAFGFKAKTAPLRFWCLFFAVLLFMVGGEEISWGQRVFGIATPESLESVNLQNEFNIHNIDGIHQHVRMVGVAFVGLFCFLIPISNRVSQKMNQFYVQWGVPLFPLNMAWLVVLSILFMVIPRAINLPEIFVLDEIGEFLLSFAWIPFALNNSLGARFNRLEYNP
ncbi:hypothetical protein [Phormidium tenue]|uniref:Uncharacterized protein n=1 Tax=Phormidium tenue NIES-30 TaxID=549789 RepID=A0A1U7JBI6_9CYAN|nr:hypothetical protein [Phormidium tenue]MBD2230054.1 hypothetical protein [Phormidium tenue FACHB-1052]OKH51105.1 hypothetical protein NIES30_03290 [Phormidium tenue NIES-30]